jgi:hypothetical protein
MTQNMKYEIINTSSVFVPIGRLFVAVENKCDDKTSSLKECLMIDEYAISDGENNPMELGSFSEEPIMISQDLENSGKKSLYIPMLKNISKAYILPHAPESAGGSYRVLDTNNVFYINWLRES